MRQSNVYALRSYKSHFKGVLRFQSYFMDHAFKILTCWTWLGLGVYILRLGGGVFIDTTDDAARKAYISVAFLSVCIIVDII